MNKKNWVFFGTSRFSTLVLDELKQNGFLPSLIITLPDKPSGRKLIMTPPEVKVWAKKEKVSFIQPETLKDPGIVTSINFCAPESTATKRGYDFFVVAAYGKIIPEHILNIPKHGVLNVHPSLLPKFRGPSPIQSAILSETETGVTIIKLDKLMDHGPIISRKKMCCWPDEDPPYEEDLERELGSEGGKILSLVIPQWLSGEIVEKEQDHSLATTCKKIEKEDGKLYLNDSPEKNLRKIRAYHSWPTAYYFHKHGEKEMRIITKRAHIDQGKLIIDRVVPEGRKEMDYTDFINGLK
jgi:methionyl-tRNA formyltransferase